MKVERIREKDGKLELYVELSPHETTEELQRAAMSEIIDKGYDYKSGEDISPVEYLQNKLGQLEASFILDESIMRHRAPFALTAERVDAIGSPVYRCAEHAVEDEPFKYQLVCVMVPEFTLSDYGPVDITVETKPVTDEEVDAELARMAKAASLSVTVTTHDVVVKGDKVELAMETTKNGKLDKALCTDGREYATGTFAMPDDFDNGVIGMKVGETKTIAYQGPELEFGADGKPLMSDYESTVTIKRIIEDKQASVDDEWAKTVRPGINSLEELRAFVVEQLKERHKVDAQRLAETLAGNELARRLEGSISDLVYGVAVKEARENLNAQLAAEGLTLDAYLAREGITQEQLNQAMMMQIRTQLTRQFALNAYADHFKLNVFDDDLDAFFEAIAPGKANLAHQDFNRDGRMHAARCAALRLKASKQAVKEANVTYVGATD